MSGMAGFVVRIGQESNNFVFFATVKVWLCARGFVENVCIHVYVHGYKDMLYLYS